ncbi:unnamed protein product [Litomosoides sigmodontis]|uniref:Uncharacterized protein n=1 Tax=Litomosoides sigmodontis TaxID=42156 RepID=A0A3P6U721_LITSI|nr:unnamed protein product [Litomosoides sigmodontis]
MRLHELDRQNSVLIVENIKRKMREMKQEKRRTLPESEYKEFKADMFDGLELPFTVNLLISSQNQASFPSSSGISNETTALGQSMSPKNQLIQKAKLKNLV